MKRKLDQDVAEAWAFVEIHKVAVGDEHPTRKGWFLVEQIGRRGEPLWYRPPSRFSVWVKRITTILYFGIIAMGFFAAIYLGV